MKIRHERTHYMRFRCVTSTPPVTKSPNPRNRGFHRGNNTVFLFSIHRTLGRVRSDDVVGKNKKIQKMHFLLGSSWQNKYAALFEWA